MQSHKDKGKLAARVLISLSPDLLAAADRQAKADCTTRSELARRELLEYLRPQDGQADGPDLYTDPDELLGILQRRKLRISIQRMYKERRHRGDVSSRPTFKQ